MIDKLEATIVPNTALKCMPCQSCLLLCTAVLLDKRRLLPAVKPNGFRLLAPWSVLSISLRAIFHGEPREFSRFSRQNTIVVHRLIIIGIVHCHHVVHARVIKVVKVAGLFVVRIVGKVELVPDREGVRKLSEEAIDTVPCAQFTPPALIFNLPDLSCQFKILNDIWIETQAHLDWFLRLSQKFLILTEPLLFHARWNGEVIRVVKRFHESLALLKDSNGQLGYRVIVRLLCEVVLGQTIDILQMCLLLQLVIADPLEIKVHHSAILVPELIHYIMICFSLFIDEDRF